MATEPPVSKGNVTGANIIKYVNLVVQVVGTGKIPLIPRDSENLQLWYLKVVFPLLVVGVHKH